jgi:hypothetical protein
MQYFKIASAGIYEKSRSHKSKHVHYLQYAQECLEFLLRRNRIQLRVDMN